jgi:hypothetical protein
MDTLIQIFAAWLIFAVPVNVLVACIANDGYGHASFN